MALKTRLRAVWTALWSGGLGASAYPWHLPAADRAPGPVSPQTALTLTSVYRACSLLSDAVSSAPVLLYGRPASGGRVVDTASAGARALATLKHQDRELFAFSTALVGNGFLRIQRDGTGAPFALVAVPAYRVSLEVEEGTRALWYRIAANPNTGEPEALLPEADVIHARYRASDDTLWGVPPMQSCSPAFAQALQSLAVQRYLFQNLSRPGGVLTAEGKMDKAVSRQLQAEFDANFTAGGVGRTAVLTNGLKYSPIIWKAADQQLLEQIQSNVQEVARAFGVPRQFLEDPVTMTYASASEGTRALYALALRGFTIRLADALAQKLLTRNDIAAGAGVEFDLSDTLILPGKEMSDFLSGLVNAGICTPNEVRNQYLHLPDVAGGDTLRIPSATVPADALSQGAKTWEPTVDYVRGQWVWHQNGLWRYADRNGEHDEPGQLSPNWDCLISGVKGFHKQSDGQVVLEMSNGDWLNEKVEK